MDDSVLWAVALGSGALGLLLLIFAGVVAVILNARARRSMGVASVDKSHPPAGDVVTTDKSQPRVASSGSKPATAGGFWIWIKAWIFAAVHAGTVSLVLGGVTFFEDLAKASDDIQRTGTVAFPKQLLPGTLTGTASRKLLSRPSGDSSGNGDAGEDAPGSPSPASAEWEVVNLADKADGE
jgi:hypothetical protein